MFALFLSDFCNMTGLMFLCIILFGKVVEGNSNLLPGTKKDKLGSKSLIEENTKSHSVPLKSIGPTYSPTWDSLDKRPLPLWYDDAKFGIFMHWGVYSVPGVASEWFWWYWKGNSKKLTQSKQLQMTEHAKVEQYMQANYRPGYNYADFAKQFKAEFFNANKFAEIVKKAGAKYIVLTTKHHEGYTMYPSKYSWNWNSKDVGPGRDMVGEMRDAIEKVGGVRFGLYFSQFEWFNRLYLQDKNNSFSTKDYPNIVSIPQMYEIINTYKPNVLWSDGDAGPAEYWNSTNFLAWLYNESPVKDYVVTNDRWGTGTACKHGGFYTCFDRYNPGKLQNHKWENCMTIDRKSWGFRRTMTYEDVFSLTELIKTLAETVSCGGNLLLNIGPTSWGMIAPIFEERLTKMGEWLAVNGEAVYGSKPWIHQNDSISSDVWYTSQVRDSSKLDPYRLFNPQSEMNTVIFAFLLRWPEDGILRLGSTIPTNRTHVSLIGYPSSSEEQTSAVKVRLYRRGIKIDLSGINWSKLPSLDAWVFKIEYLKEDQTDPTTNILNYAKKNIQT